jgi:hypothetical protein
MCHPSQQLLRIFLFGVQLGTTVYLYLKYFEYILRVI